MTSDLSIITTLRLGIIWSQLPTQKPRQNDAPQRIRTAHRRHRRTAEELRNQRTQDTSSTRTPPEEAFSSREFSRRPSGRSLLIKRALPEARAASFLGFSHVVPVKNTPWASSTLWGYWITYRKISEKNIRRRFEFPNPPHTRPCRLERVHTPTAHLFRKCSNGAFCTSKQHISPRRNDRVRPHTRGGRPHRSGARPTARPQQQQQHQQPQHQQQTAAQQQHHKFARSEHHNLGRRGANSSR